MFDKKTRFFIFLKASRKEGTKTLFDPCIPFSPFFHPLAVTWLLGTIFLLHVIWLFSYTDRYIFSAVFLHCICMYTNFMDPGHDSYQPESYIIFGYVFFLDRSWFRESPEPYLDPYKSPNWIRINSLQEHYESGSTFFMIHRILNKMYGSPLNYTIIKNNG